MYGKINGESVQLGLPYTGVLSCGNTVSGYHLLPEETLLAEGWQVVQEDKPEYDSATQQLEISTKEIVDGQIVVTYVTVERPVEEYEQI